MPTEARTALLEVAAAEDLLVIEDNPYGFFAREPGDRPTLKALDRHGRVVYLGSFAKTCFPGRPPRLRPRRPAGHRTGRLHSLLADQRSPHRTAPPACSPTSWPS
ncbi:hypothetical protein GCM10020229_06530 [Kitasatospora albolonga]|uniref:hypothetical protein n=1 Tax=Kitasatospora albolonga TaxID=68173 RepID=UPI0031EE299D